MPEPPAEISLIARSYESHRKHFDTYARAGEQSERAQSWFRTDTVDAWRHMRMYRVLDPFVEAYPGSSWLTVGDGRYGKDSRYLSDHGCAALPTDIAETLLAEAKLSGYIADYRCENAESLSFADNTFDFVFCKEALHHFPRPAVALYEMLRVATHGVVLVEPNDRAVPASPLDAVSLGLRQMLRRLRGKPLLTHEFEPSGNYVFCLSAREVEKMAIGIGCRATAFAYLNDAYIDGVEHEPATRENRTFRRVRSKIVMADFLSRYLRTGYGLIAAAIMKRGLQNSLSVALARQGFTINTLPRNPYLDLA